MSVHAFDLANKPLVLCKHQEGTSSSSKFTHFARLTLLALGAWLATPLQAQVQAPPSIPSKQFDVCIDKSSGVTVEMLECIGTEAERQDKLLNDNYKALSGDLTAERRKQLQVAQRLWIQYRDANCNFYADPDGGSMATIAAADCVMRMTAQRAQELKDLAIP